MAGTHDPDGIVMIPHIDPSKPIEPQMAAIAERRRCAEEDPDSFYKFSPEDLKNIRGRFGLTQSKMANLLGCAPQQLRRMETPEGKNNHRPVTRTTGRLLRAYLDGYRPADWPSGKSG